MYWQSKYPFLINIIESLEKIPEGANAIIDCTQTKVIEHDIQEVIDNYQMHAQLKNIEVEVLHYKTNN